MNNNTILKTFTELVTAVVQEKITGAFSEKNRERLEEISKELVDIYNEEMKGKNMAGNSIHFTVFCNEIIGKAFKLKRSSGTIQKK